LASSSVPCGKPGSWGRVMALKTNGGGCSRSGEDRQHNRSRIFEPVGQWQEVAVSYCLREEYCHR
jgi:hypothetical protein